MGVTAGAAGGGAGGAGAGPRPGGSGTDAAIAAFAEDVGEEGPVVCVGGRTQWAIGGPVATGAREVSAPGGVVSHQPEEMIVRVRAGTTVAELDTVLAAGGQMTPLDAADPERATVGGVLAVGHSGWRRLRYGPVRDTVLETHYISARGTVIKAGAPVVKNVTGYDLCRLLVGSLGTIGFLAEVVLRALPRPAASCWLVGQGEPGEVRRRLFRPSSVLWDGAQVWVLLEGHPADVAAERAALGGQFHETDGPPPRPAGARLSVRPSSIIAAVGDAQPGSFVAEIGVGTVHFREPGPPGQPDPSTAELHARVKRAFDPTGRLNPGRAVA